MQLLLFTLLAVVKIIENTLNLILDILNEKFYRGLQHK